MSVRISAVVCTYNRAGLLADALQSLCNQTLSSEQYEIIVVDNNSSDETYAATSEFCRRYPNVRYFFEPRQGVSHARNRGWQEARGDYVGYLDDDCEAPKEWLAIASELIDRKSPGVFGGRVLPRYDASKPRWYKDRYASSEQGDEARVLNPGVLPGANMFLSRPLMHKVGGFDTSLGHRGKARAFGEETAIQYSIRATMPDQVIYYDPSLYVCHLVQAKHMTMRWILRESFTYGRYSRRWTRRNLPGRRTLFMKIVKSLLVLSMDIVLSVLRRDRIRFPYVQNYLYEKTLKHVYDLGRIFEQYRQVSQRS